MLTFVEFVNQVKPRYQWYWHVEKLAAVLQRVADDEIKRLMIFMPPRHGKSELVSRLFAAYYLHKHPEREVGICSYGARKAYEFSRSARDNFRRIGGLIREDASAKSEWLTHKGGGVWAAGVGGPITGFGFHLGIIDDPIKNSQEAHSVTIRKTHKDWYQSTFYTREEPGGAQIIIQTRWHEEDLSGILLAEENDDEPEGWHIVNFPAIKPLESSKFPTACTVESDERKQGEALCPERYDLPRLRKIKKKVGSYYWSALYAQTPTPDEGNIFKRQWWRFWKPRGLDLPAVTVRLEDESVIECLCIDKPLFFDEVIQSWDMAFKDTESSSYVVGQVWGRQGGNFFLLDQERERMGLPASIAAVQRMSAHWPEAYAILIEDKANGPAVIQTLSSSIPGLIPIEPMGDKIARAHAASPFAESGNVYLPHRLVASWVPDYIKELSSFPSSANSDQVDATSQALIRLQESINHGWDDNPIQNYRG